jgi:hypothetical protein
LLTHSAETPLLAGIARATIGSLVGWRPAVRIWLARTMPIWTFTSRRRRGSLPPTW